MKYQYIMKIMGSFQKDWTTEKPSYFGILDVFYLLKTL